MATQLFFNDNNPNAHLGVTRATFQGSTPWWHTHNMTGSRGGSTVSITTSTQAGPVSGVECSSASAIPYQWITYPLAADAIITSSITFNLWASENSMSANSAINCAIYRVQPDGTVTQIIKTARTTELGTSQAAANFTASPTSTSCAKGDRLLFVVFIDDAGTMASGFTFTFGYNGPTAGSNGDSYVTLTETLSFDTGGTGTIYYLRSSNASINPGSAIEKNLSTSRGSGAVSYVTNQSTGPTAGQQLTDSGGGTAIEWYTPPLNAVTLTGTHTVNIRGMESSTGGNASLRAELAKTAGDGTSATVISSWCQGAGLSTGEMVDTTEGPNVILLSHDDVSVAQGERLRLRILVDDMSAGNVISTGNITVYVDGTSVGGSGDSYIRFAQTLTEASTGPTPASIVRTRAIGSVTVSPQLKPASITRTRAQGSLTVSPQVVPASITRTRALGTPNVVLLVQPGALTRTRALGSPTVSPQVLPASIARTRALGTPNVVQIIQPGSISRTRALGSPTVAASASITPASITRTRAIGTPTVNVAIPAASITRTRALGTPTVSPQVLPSSITRTRALGTPNVVQIVQPGSITRTRALGGPTVNPQVVVASLARSRAIGDITVVTGSAITPASITRTRALGSPTVSPQVVVASITRSRALGQPLVAPAPTSIVRTRALGTPTLSPQAIIPAIVRSRALGSPTANPQIVMSAITRTRALGTPDVLWNLIVSPASISRARGLGSPVIGPSAVPSAIVRSRALGTPTMNPQLKPASLLRERALGLPTTDDGLGGVAGYAGYEEEHHHVRS